MNNPLKAIIVEGLIEQEEITYHLCPDYFKLQSGLWEIAINSVAFTFLTDNTKDYIFNISSNLVQGDKIEKGKLTRFNVVLQQIKIEKNIEKHIIRFQTPLWFLVNHSPNDYLSIFLKEWPTPMKKSKDLKMVLAVNVLFRRIL